MPTGLWNVEWANLNASRRYPLADDASGTDASGSFTLPADFLVGLDLPVHRGMDVDPARFFVYKVGVHSGGYFIVVGYQPADGDPVEVATASVFKTGHVPNKVYALGGVEPYADTAGKVVVGRLDGIDGQPAGQWTFDLDNARLDPDTVRPIIQGVAALVLVNGTQRSVPLQGDVEVRAGTNIRLVALVEAGQDPVIRIDAISGEGLTEECICEGEAAPKDPITTIDGIPPTEGGDYTVVAGSCLEISPIANGIRIDDVCSKPCCGCEDLEKITQDLELLGSQIASVQQFVQSLATAVETMNAVVLGARLGDDGCVTC